MKKNLLIISFSAFVLVARSQTATNKEYTSTFADDEGVRPKLIYFIGDMNEDRILLKWNVAENESVNLFEVKKSYDGKNFTTSGFIMGNEKKGNETYFFPEILPQEQKVYYRLKIIGTNKKVKFSNVISLQPSVVGKTSVAAVSGGVSNLTTTK